jgi:hypothetical protein
MGYSRFKQKIPSPSITVFRTPDRLPGSPSEEERQNRRLGNQ